MKELTAYNLIIGRAIHCALRDVILIYCFQYTKIIILSIVNMYEITESHSDSNTADRR